MNPIIEKSWNYSEEEYDHGHDFIQCAFPTDKVSMFNPDAPLITTETAESIGLDRSFDRFIEQLGIGYEQDQFVISNRDRFDKYIMRQNHTFLRVSRVLRSLFLLDRKDKAFQFNEFLQSFKDIRKGTDYDNECRQLSYKYWNESLM